MLAAPGEASAPDNPQRTGDTRYIFIDPGGLDPAHTKPGSNSGLRLSSASLAPLAERKPPSSLLPI